MRKSPDNITPIILVLLSLLVACRGEPAENQTILRFLEEGKGKRFNLDFQIESCEYLGPVTGRDSAGFLSAYVEARGKQSIRMIRDSLDFFDGDLERLRGNLETESDPEKKEELETQLATSQRQLDRYNDALQRYLTDYRGTFLERDYRLLKDYENRGEELLAHRYRCSVTMQNPLLSKVKREVTQIFVLSPDKMEVIRQSDD